MLGQVVLSTFLFHLVSAQVQLQPSPLNGIRGQNLTIRCTFPRNTVSIQLRLGNTDITTLPKFLSSGAIGDTAFEYIYGPLEDSDDGSMFTCDDSNGNTDNDTLAVLYAPELSVQPNMVESNLTGSAVFNYTVQANPPISSGVVYRDGELVIERIDDSDSSIIFSDIRCRDNGTYTLWSNNTVGSSSVTFSLAVMRSPPIWLVVNRIFEDSNVMNLSEIVIACPEELFNVSCAFSDINAPVQFTTIFNSAEMTLELLITPDSVSGISRRITANAICTARNQLGTTQSGVLTVVKPLSGTGTTLGPGEIAGIAIGSIVGVTIIVGIVIAIIIGICCYLKKR